MDGAIRALVEPHFDADFYLGSGPDLARAPGDPLAHFLNWGWREGRNPSPAFDVVFYLATNPDVAAAGLNPLVHYLQGGREEGRLPLPPVDGLETFDAAFYLAMNPDVAAAGAHPLMHYLQSGRREGRLPCKPADAWRTALTAARSPRAKMRAVTTIEAHDCVPPERVARRLEEASAAQGLVIVFSHDDYRDNRGGVQTVIGDEERAFNAAGWGFLHLSPAVPVALPMLADDVPAAATFLSARLNGDRLGLVRFGDLLETIEQLRLRARPMQVVVHHLGGHAPELVSRLVRISGPVRPIVWVHDFFTICPSYFLLRNDVSPCGAPPVSSPACGICCYGEERAGHLTRVQRMFAETAPIVFAPSAHALEEWRRSGLPHSQAVVVPLARLVSIVSTAIDASNRRRLPRPLRVAHVGSPSFHKGWHVFEALASGLANDRRYELFHFGVPSLIPVPANIVQIRVEVQAGDRDVMIRALQQHEIDVVLSWSLCQESFSFTTYEALAAGAFIVVRAGSGNVWPAVLMNAPAQGCLAHDEAELFALFAGDRLTSYVTGQERRRLAFVAGHSTADWLLSRETVDAAGSV
jgi:hypothetical protein